MVVGFLWLQMIIMDFFYSNLLIILLWIGIWCNTNSVSVNMYLPDTQYKEFSKCQIKIRLEYFVEQIVK